MNYIKELNAFYDWLETNSLSTSAIVLWHALMHINNKAGWAEEFGVATSVLCVKTGLSDRTIRNARNELKQKGRIDWKSRKGNRSAIYKIIPLSETKPENITGKTSSKDNKKDLPEINADNVSGNTSDNTSGNTSGNVSALNKLNKTKQNKNSSSTTTETNSIFNENFSELAKLYQQVIGQPNGLTADWIKTLLNEYGFSWVKNAMLEAEKRGKRTKKYIEGILQNWKANGGMKLSKDSPPKENTNMQDYGW